MPSWFLAPIGGLKLPTLGWCVYRNWITPVYWSGAYTEAVLLLCLLEWWVYRSCITFVSTEVVCIQKLYYSCVYWSGVYAEAVLLMCLLKWGVYRSCITEVACIYRSCPSGVRSLCGGCCAWLRRLWWSGTQPHTTSSPSGLSPWLLPWSDPRKGRPSSHFY